MCQKMAGTLFLLLALMTCACYANDLKLTQVVILSRHNLRTPLTENLARMTPKQWPDWGMAAGQLTAKGALLESYMGEYVSDWLAEEGLFTDKCPDQNSVHIYANTRQRTKETAKSFAKSAFPDCDIVVNHKNITEMDPIFHPILLNMTEKFQNAVQQEMQDKLALSDLKQAYLELNRITDIKNSLICKEDNYCDLAEDKDEILFEIGIEPNVTGPMFIGSSMVDSFLMSYYEGHPLQEIAWGEIKNKNQWKLLTKLVTEAQNVRLNLTTAAKELCRPLLRYLRDKIESDKKLILLVGHDSNLSSLISALGFKSYVLPEQAERTPIGGKLVFQKWTDGADDFLKVEFIYQSSKQLRNGDKLSLCNPPKKFTMEISKCPTDKQGYCSWDTFIKILNGLVDQ